jgi:hypothetical protein
MAAGFPVVRALIDPPDTVESASVLFRPEGYPRWYETPMRREGEGFLAVLPKPRPSARRIHYVVQVMAPGHPRSRGREHSAPVVEELTQCGGAPAETAETAAISVRVPSGAPTVPPVPPGFAPVGTANLQDPERRRSALPLIIAGGFGGALAGVFALDTETEPPAVTATTDIAFTGSTPPPGGRLSLSGGPALRVFVRIRVSNARALEPGVIRVTLYRGSSVARPCAVLVAPHAGFGAGSQPELPVTGPFAHAEVCQPSEFIRLELEEGGRLIASTGANGRDLPARYFIDP